MDNSQSKEGHAVKEGDADAQLYELSTLFKETLQAKLPAWVRDYAEETDKISFARGLSLISDWITFLRQEIGGNIHAPDANRLLKSRQIFEEAEVVEDLRVSSYLYLGASSLAIGGGSEVESWHSMIKYLQTVVEDGIVRKNYSEARSYCLIQILLINVMGHLKPGYSPDTMALLVRNAVQDFLNTIKYFNMSEEFWLIFSDVKHLKQLALPYLGSDLGLGVTILFDLFGSVEKIWDSDATDLLEHYSIVEERVDKLDYFTKTSQNIDTTILFTDICKTLRKQLKQFRSDIDNAKVFEIIASSPTLDLKNECITFTLEVKNTIFFDLQDTSLEILSTDDYSFKSGRLEVGRIAPRDSRFVKVSISSQVIYDSLKIYCKLHYMDEGKKEQSGLSVITLKFNFISSGEEEDTAFDDHMLTNRFGELEMTLRKLVETNYLASKGSGWELHIKNKYPDIYDECVKIRNRSQKSGLDSSKEDEALVNFTTLEHLRRLITSQWVLFSSIFDFKQGNQNKYLFSMNMQSIMAARNALYHHRSHPTIEKMRALVACDDLLRCIKQSKG